jgi:uncharacterized RDD family membrane protein YckC
VEKREDGYYLIDKNSSNGTFINGKKISEQKLSHNDKISLGNASLVFEDEEQVSATFILPRSESPAGAPSLPKADEVSTEAVDMGQMAESQPAPPATQAEMPTPPPPPSRPVPAPPPPVAQRPVAAPAPPPPPRPAAPPPPAPPPPMAQPAPPPPPRVEAQPACPSCKRPVEPGVRFCGYCGAPTAAKPAPAPAPPSPPPQQAAPPRPAAPPPPAPPPPRPAPPAAAPGRPFAPPAAPMPKTRALAGQMTYAGFGPRLAAYFIDAIVLSLLLVLPIAVTMVVSTRAQISGEFSPIAMVLIAACSLLMLIISLGYQLYFVGAKGATPGKKIMKLRIALPDGSYPVGYGKAFLRMIGYVISGAICYIGFLMILFDKEQHRGLHDRIAGTVVVKED